MTGCVLNMTWFVQKYDWSCPYIIGCVLNMTGVVLTATGFDDYVDKSNGMANKTFLTISCLL